MIHPIEHMVVLIPARDEELLLPQCLESVLQAQGVLPPEVTSDIVVVVDCSTDRTLKIARAMLQGFGTATTVCAGMVGCARSHAAHLSLQRYGGPLERCWLANTDADCVVPENWLVDQLLAARTGVHALAGIVGVDNFFEHGVGVARRFQETYTIHADGTHPHVHGANIGVRADAYVQAGGWAPLATAEDHDLWKRLAHLGCCRVSSAALKVITSGRRVGRAPRGFAEALAAHNEEAA